MGGWPKRICAKSKEWKTFLFKNIPSQIEIHSTATRSKAISGLDLSKPSQPLVVLNFLMGI